MGLTTQLQYCMASFLQQNLKYKNRHKARKMDGVVHREVRDDGPVSCTKLYLLCSNFFFFFLENTSRETQDPPSSDYIST